jgi:hypothetical protein
MKAGTGSIELERQVISLDTNLGWPGLGLGFVVCFMLRLAALFLLGPPHLEASFCPPLLGLLAAMIFSGFLASLCDRPTPGEAFLAVASARHALNVAMPCAR